MLRVLLVDDAEAYRLTFAALLEDAGHEVLEAASLAEAAERLGDGLDLVVLDLHLADGLGTALVPEIRRRSPGAAIALISGSGGAAGHARDVDLIVEKGTDPERVLEALVRLAAVRGRR